MTLKIAHRGFSSKYTENTIIAYEKAIEYGCDMIELDIQLTADNKIVVCHDDNLKRFGYKNIYVTKLNYNDLKKIQIVLKKTHPPQNIPLLDYIMKKYLNKIELNIEIKTESNKERIIDNLLEILKKYKHGRIIISCDDFEYLEYFKQGNKDIRAGYIARKLDNKTIQESKKLGLYSIHLKERFANKISIASIKDNNFKCYVWTVDNKQRAEELIKNKVDGIMTNDIKIFERE